MKPTMVITNQYLLEALDNGPVPHGRRMRAKTITRKYKDATGKTRYVGTRALKKSQTLSCLKVLNFYLLFPIMYPLKPTDC